MLVIALLTPLGFFAYRAGQPMDWKEFKGLSYYQRLSTRQAARAELAIAYQASHPEVHIYER